ncbi:MAG: glycosyl hydrolase family 8 [Salinivirgaceae bacterium]|jgi:uncharacterized protein YjdB|nr:glycosyl hydrolase family 8 [Salinivirgaceae bacterium]
MKMFLNFKRVLFKWSKVLNQWLKVMVFMIFMIAFSSSLLMAQTPVAANGKLKVVGTQLVNQNSEAIQLRGMSSHGVNWFTHEYNFESMNVMVNEWGIDVFRIAMYPTEKPDQTFGGYEGNPDFWKQYVDDLVDLCEQFGVYCMIDWHVLTPGNPNEEPYFSMAKEFWQYMSQKHSGKDHVLYEICNEPNGNVSWGQVKDYADTIIDIIRANDSNTIIIVGNPGWSSEVHTASETPITGVSNLMYSLHFYAGEGSHQAYRSRITTAIENGVAVFVTEWGTTPASGNGAPNQSETNTWLQFMRDNNISWCNWSYSDKPEGSAALEPYSGADNLWDNTTASGGWIKNAILSPADTWSTSGNKPAVVSISRELYGAYFLNGETIALTSQAVDADGSVSSVSYYANGSLIGTATGAPYEVAWTPVSTDAYKVTAVVTDNSSATNTSVAYTINVVNEIVQTAYPNGTPHVIPGTIKTIEFDNGGEMIAYHDIDAVHKGPTGADRAEEGVDVEGSSNIGYVLNDEWLEYTVDIANSGNYDFNLKATSGYAVTGAIHLELDGVVISPVKEIPSSGNWWTYQDNIIEDVPMTEGVHVLRLVFDKGFFNVSDMVFTYVGGNIPVTGISVTPTTLTVNKDANATIAPTISPANATNKTITWTSSNTAVATVNSSGIVTGKAAGTAIVTAKTVDGNKQATCNITVTNVNIPVTGVELVPASLSIEQGKSNSLTANVIPSNASNKALTFSSNNTSVATVSASGAVSGVSLGTVNITVTTADGSFTDVTVITVTEPQENAYPFGILPSNGSVADAQSAYDTFMDLFFEDCNDGKGRIKWGLATNGWEQPGQSVSEGIAYGMLLAAYYNDQTKFDKLWNYYKAFPDANGLMHWKTQGCSSVIEQNAATDAEIDAAMALIVADKVFGSSGSVNYESDAKWIIGKIKQHEVESGSYVLKPGDVFGGSDLTNISYFAPGYFKAFGQYTEDEAFWNNVVDKCYQIIDANLSANNAVGGLVSDWCNANGTQGQGKSLSYSYDACRTNWRVATDYVWYGDARAKSYLDKSNDFIQNFVGGIENIVDGYQQNGSEISGDRYHNNTFVSTFACAGVALSNVTELNTYYSEIETVAPVGYFDYCFDIFGRTLLTGIFLNPTEPIIVIPVTGLSLSETVLSLEKGENSTLVATVTPANATNKTVTWTSSNENIATVNSSGLVTAIAEGNATITVTSSNPAIKATCEVTVSETPDEQQAYPNGVAHAIPGSIESVNYDIGGEDIAYHDSNDGNTGSGPRQDENVDTEYKIAAGNVGWIATGEWLEFTVNVEQSTSFDFEILVASTGNNGAYHIEFNGVDKTGLQNVDATGGWASFVPQTIENIQLTAGKQVMRIYMDGGSFNLGTITITSDNECIATAITPNVKINNGALVQSNQASAQEGDNVLLSPIAGNDGSWSWSGPAGFSSTSREVTLNNIQQSKAGNYVVNYTNNCGTTSTETFTVVVGSVVTYTLTTDVNGSGSIVLNPAGGVYNAGVAVTATAIAQTGWHFVNWSGDASGTNDEVDLIMNSNLSITANFELNGNDPCDNPTPVTVTFEHTGSGQYCWVTSDDISYVNSWNVSTLEINGVDFANNWANSLPAKINGNYYISFDGSVGWSHFEAVGSGKSASVATSNQVEQAFANVRVYPNPLADQELVIEGADNFVNSNLHIYDLSGKLVFTHKIVSEKTIIAKSVFDKGFYVLELSNNENKKLIKLMVE